MTVLDSSAVLAYLLGETGSDKVQVRLNGAVIGAANLSEVLAKFDSEIEANFASALLESMGVKTEPVTHIDARVAASMKKRARHLSLGDRLCLALGERLDAVVVTADRAWGTDGRIQQIR